MTLRALAIAVALIAAPVVAAATTYILDRSHAHVTFTVDHLGFSTVHGQFREFDADINFDPENVEATRVRFVIDAASVDTLWPARDHHLRSKDFFDVENFPEIVFESTAVELTDVDQAIVRGNLTLRGVTREVELEAKLNKIGPSPFDPTLMVVGFSATGEIDRTEFGMNFAAPAVGSIIPVRIDLEMSPAS